MVDGRSSAGAARAADHERASMMRLAANCSLREDPLSSTTRSAGDNITPLSAMAQRRIAGALGLDALPDRLAMLIARLIVCVASCAADTMMRTAPRLCGKVGPPFSIDRKTFTRLAPIVAKPGMPWLAVIDALGREIDILPPIKPRRAALAAHVLQQFW